MNCMKNVRTCINQLIKMFIKKFLYNILNIKSLAFSISLLYVFLFLKNIFKLFYASADQKSLSEPFAKYFKCNKIIGFYSVVFIILKTHIPFKLLTVAHVKYVNRWHVIVCNFRQMLGDSVNKHLNGFVLNKLLKNHRIHSDVEGYFCILVASAVWLQIVIQGLLSLLVLTLYVHSKIIKKNTEAVGKWLKPYGNCNNIVFISLLVLYHFFVS